MSAQPSETSTEPKKPTRRFAELMLLVLAVGICMFAYVIASIGAAETIPTDVWGMTLGFIALAAVAHVFVRWAAPYADPLILPITFMINGLGLVLIRRSDIANARSDANSQLLWTTVGVGCCIAVIFLVKDHRLLSRFTFTAMVAGLVLLILPMVPFLGHSVNGATIWIKLGPFTFQPGELAKIALTIFFAGYLVSAKDSLSLTGKKILFLQLPRGKDMGPILVVWAVSVVVLVMQTDLGTSLLLFGIFVAMIYVATERTSWIVIGLSLFLGAAFTAWRLFPHVQIRVQGWLDPFNSETVTGSTRQLAQGVFGMASGGLIGSGLGQGSPWLVTFVWSDSIFTLVGEELGLVGVFAVLMLYLLLVERGFRTALGVRDGFGKLLASGVSFSIALGVFVVVGGVTRVIPVTGLVLPFMAAGGSSLISNWMIVGLLLRISHSARRPGALPPTPAQGIPIEAEAGS